MLLRFVFLGLVTVFGASLLAQELTDKQRNLSGRYAQLEQILLRLAETSGNSNSRQAALLKKALLESKDKLIVRRFETLVNTLERRQLSDAITGQTEIEQDLLLLLQLLESENRIERRDEEKEKIKEFLKDLEEILHSERMLKNQTQQQESASLPMLEKNQQQIREQTQTLRDRIEEHEGTSPQKESPSDSNELAEQSKKKESEQSESQAEQSQQKQEQSPSQRTLQKALERMKQAEQKLKEAKKEGSVEEQEEAIAELQRLKEELEKILRQLREEELMQTLEKLEERFKRMFRQEQGIRAQTERLIGESANESDQRQTTIKSDRLGIEQQSVIDEAESALLLLREDGSAQAMVESLLQARFDMMDVKSRLERTILDTTTLHVEDAVIDALQEMLLAVQSAKEEAKQRQDKGEDQESDGEADKEPLIQLLAELRMLRSMQQRVNDRTKRYDDEIKQMLEKPDADLSLLKRAVEELARQQNRISRILHELKIGRTQ